jgi:hypothetical protein
MNKESRKAGSTAQRDSAPVLSALLSGATLRVKEVVGSLVPPATTRAGTAQARHPYLTARIIIPGNSRTAQHLK